jgi:hypothetical protein
MVNLSQEFDKEAKGQTSKPKESKASLDNKDKKGSTVPPAPSEKHQPTGPTESATAESKNASEASVPDPTGAQPSKDAASGKVSPDQGKSESSTPSNTTTQGDPNLPSNKKMTAKQWGANFVAKHQEMLAKKAKTQEFVQPESLKERLIREGKSHPDPKDPKFAQYFKEKAIKPTHPESNTSDNNEGGNSKDSAGTPSIATPTTKVYPKRGAGFCSTFASLLSPGGTKPKGSPSSSASSASYVDPESLKTGAKKGAKENTIDGEGDPEETINPKVTTMEDPTPDAPDPSVPIEDNSTSVIPPEGEVVAEETIIVVKEIKTGVSNEELPPQNRDNPEDIAGNPPEEPIGGSEDNSSTLQDGSSNTASEQWQTVLDRRIAKKNKKALKNKEKQQKRQAKLLR